MRQESGLSGNQPTLGRNDVHCSQAVGNVDVVPVITELDFIKSWMVNICLR